MAIVDSIKRAAAALLRPRVVTPPAPNATIPTSSQRARLDPKTAAAMRSIDSMLGRVTYGAGPVQTRYSTVPGTGLTPERIYQVHQQNRMGYPLQKAELDEEVLDRDAHLYGLQQARIVEVSNKPLKLMPFNESPLAAAVASFCEAILYDLDGYDQDVEDLLTASGRGYACSEVTWDFRKVRCTTPGGERVTLSNVIRPIALDWVHPKHFRFDAVTDEPYLVTAGGDLARLLPGKFVFHASSGTGLIERRGYMMQCVWLHAIKQWSLRDWVVYSNLFGVPQIHGIYDGTHQLDEDRETYSQILRDFGQGIPVLHGADFRIEAQHAPEGGRSNDVFGALIGYSNAEMSKRIQGQTLTTEIGGQGSYALGEVQADVKYGIVKSDARKLAQTERSDLLRPIVQLNSELLARAFGADPDDIMACVPRVSRRIERETTPEIRQRILAGLQDMGLPLDEEQIREEFGADAPRPGSRPVSKEPPPEAAPPAAAPPDAPPTPPTPPTPPASDAPRTALNMERAAETLANFARGGAIVHPRDVLQAFGVAIDAAMEDLAPSGKGEGDGGGRGKKDLAEALFAHTDQPRDANGRFAKTAGAKASVAQKIAKHLTENGHAAEADGSTVRLKSGATIDIGDRGERSYSEGSSHKVQALVEGHLREHADKHVRDWASKTTPAPIPKRKIDPAKAAARAKAREERQAAKDKERAARAEAREAKRAARAEANQARAKAVAERRQAREQKRAEQVRALQELGAPVGKNGKIDASRVPGASKGFRPLVSADPENSFRGRSFSARSAKEMQAEFLGAAGRGGDNEQILRQQLGHLQVRDPVQWEAISEKYEKPVATFDEAFAVLAKAASKGTPNRKPDWRNFDLQALQECSGLQGLQLPAWMHEAQLSAQEREHYAEAAASGDYEQGDDYGDDSGLVYHPPKENSEVPF